MEGLNYTYKTFGDTDKDSFAASKSSNLSLSHYNQNFPHDVELPSDDLRKFRFLRLGDRYAGWRKFSGSTMPQLNNSIEPALYRDIDKTQHFFPEEPFLRKVFEEKNSLPDLSFKPEDKSLGNFTKHLDF